jgi:hypothetical protein
MSATVVADLTATLLRAALDLGFDRAGLLAQSGLVPEALDDPDGRIPLEVHLRLWEAIIASAPDDIGLRGHIGTQMPAPHRCPDAHCWEVEHAQNPLVHCPLLPH